MSLLVGCAVIKHDAAYDQDISAQQSGLDNWGIKGRLALFGAADSWTASIDWRHKPGDDLLKLSGPLGQGGLIIALFGDCITVSYAVDQSETSCQVDELIQKYLGVRVPVSNLSYWVLGLPAPDQSFQMQPDGFIQAGWHVAFLKNVEIDGRQLPKKIFISKDQSKLKLLIDHWVLNEFHTE